ncbi:MAG: hypothetical protein ACRCWH_07100 [Aeromonas veronii]
MNFEKWLSMAYKRGTSSGFSKYGSSAFWNIFPETKKCPVCQVRLTVAGISGEATLFGPLLIPVQLYRGSCSTPGCEGAKTDHYYSGHADFVINYNNQQLCPLEFVTDYLQSYASSGLPVQAWWDSKCVRYLNLLNIDTSSEEARCLARRRGDISRAFSAASELFDFGKTFKCCENPEVISMDGIVLSVKSKEMPKFVRPWMMDGLEISRGSDRVLRQLPRLTSHECKVLKDFLHSPDGASQKDLRSVSGNTRNLGLTMLIEVHSHMDRHLVCRSCDPVLRPFGKFLKATVAPVVTLVPYQLYSCLARIVSVQKFGISADRQRFEREAPVFFGLLSSLETVSSQVPLVESERLWRIMKGFVQDIRTHQNATFHYSEEGLVQEISAEEHQKIMNDLPRKHPNNPDMDELWSTGCYFPGYRICRKIKDIHITAKECKTCNKDYFKGGACAPGVVLFYCVAHQICIGFVVLDNAEGPRTIYETLITRFQNLPELVIYDNGCNLNEYILNRLPRTTRGMRVMVDGFHWKSHTNCAPTFDTKLHTLSTGHLNTSLNEQRNSTLAKLKASAPLLLARTFFSFLRFAVGVRNIQQHHKIKEQGEQQRQIDRL